MSTSCSSWQASQSEELKCHSLPVHRAFSCSVSSCSFLLRQKAVESVSPCLLSPRCGNYFDLWVHSSLVCRNFTGETFYQSTAGGVAILLKLLWWGRQPLPASSLYHCWWPCRVNFCLCLLKGANQLKQRLPREGQHRCQEGKSKTDPSLLCRISRRPSKWGGHLLSAKASSSSFWLQRSGGQSPPSPTFCLSLALLCLVEEPPFLKGRLLLFLCLLFIPFTLLFFLFVFKHK